MLFQKQCWWCRGHRYEYGDFRTGLCVELTFSWHTDLEGWTSVYFFGVWGVIQTTWFLLWQVHWNQLSFWKEPGEPVASATSPNTLSNQLHPIGSGPFSFAFLKQDFNDRLTFFQVCTFYAVKYSAWFPLNITLQTIERIAVINRWLTTCSKRNRKRDKWRNVCTDGIVLLCLFCQTIVRKKKNRESATEIYWEEVKCCAIVWFFFDAEDWYLLHAPDLVSHEALKAQYG